MSDLESRSLSIAELADILNRTGDDFKDIDRSCPGATPAGNLVLPASASSAPMQFQSDPSIVRQPGKIPEPDSDPLRDAWRSGFEDGVATEKRTSERWSSENREMLAELSNHIHLLDAAAMHLLEKRICDTVIALCRQVIVECPFDPERLTDRVRSAVALLASTHNHRTIELNSLDADQLSGKLPIEWEILVNPDLARGGFRVVTDAGGVEDGPDRWTDAIEAAVRTC